MAPDTDGDALLALPHEVLNEILRGKRREGAAEGLSAADLKAFRSLCTVARRAVNEDVETLRIGAGSVASTALQRLQREFSQLKRLGLYDDDVNSRVTGACLESFLKSEKSDEQAAGSAAASHANSSPFASTNLQVLDVKCCLFISAKELQQLLLACKPSELLAPRWAEPPHLRALSVASATLTSLDLGDATTDVISLLDSGLAALPPLPLLRSLSLRRCTAVTDAGVSNLTCAKFPSLTHLDLTSTRVAGATGFTSLAGQLQSLVLLRCRAFGDAGLRAVCEQQAGSLTSLVLCGTGVPATGVALWCLQPAARLQELDLGPSWELDGEGLAALACCPDLRELRLGNFHLVPARLPADNNNGNNDNGAGGNAGLPLPGGAAAAAANAVAAAGAAAAVWLPADQLAAAAAAAAAAAERQPWMPTPAARPLERLRVLRLGGMFAQHGLRLILPRLRRLVTLELSGLSTARDSVLAELVKAAEGAASAGKTKQSGRQAQGQGQGQGRAQEQGQLPSRQGSVDSNGSGGGGSVCSPRSGSGYSIGSSSWGRGEDEEGEDEEMEAAASGGSSGMLRLQELRLVSAGPDLTAAGLLQLAALPRLKRLSLVACPCATEPAVQQLVAAVRGRRDGGGAAAAAAVGAAAGGGGGSGGGGGDGEVRQVRRRRRLRLEVLTRANSSPTGSMGGAAAGAAQPQAEAPAPQVYNI